MLQAQAHKERIVVVEDVERSWNVQEMTVQECGAQSGCGIYELSCQKPRLLSRIMVSKFLAIFKLQVARKSASFERIHLLDKRYHMFIMSSMVKKRILPVGGLQLEDACELRRRRYLGFPS